MEYSKVAGAKSLPKTKRGLFRYLKTRKHNSDNDKNGRSSMLESIAKVSGGSVVSQSEEEGVVRIKIVVRKQDLDKVLQVMQGDHGTKRSAEKSCVEQRLNLLRKKHARKGSWTPALQTIPEYF